MFAIVFLIVVYMYFAAIIFLPDTGVYDHGFVFVDEQNQNLATIFVCLMPVLIVAMLNRLPHSTFRTCMNCVAFPTAFCSVLTIAACIAMMVFRLPSPFHCSIGPSTQVNGLGVRLLYQDYNSKFGDNDCRCILRLEKDLFGSVLREYKNLVVIDPAQGATIEYLDNGANVKLVVPYHYNLIPINRVFRTDWIANISQPCLKIDRTY